MKRVVIIGSGNLGSTLALAVAGTEGLELRQVVRRNEKTLAEADLYLICVSDRAIEEVAASLPIPREATVVHTAGSVGMEALARFPRRGVIYPLQTFTRGRAVDFRQVPLFVEGATEAVTQELEAFAGRLSGTVRRASSDERARLHLAAVFACNFVNHLYATGAKIAGQPFELLKPLIAETAAKALSVEDPAQVQTGPAVRGDRAVLARHEQMLGEGRLGELYELISDDIWETSKKTL